MTHSNPSPTSERQRLIIVPRVGAFDRGHRGAPGPDSFNKAYPCTQLPSKLGQRMSMLTAETAFKECCWTCSGNFVELETRGCSNGLPLGRHVTRRGLVQVNSHFNGFSTHNTNPTNCSRSKPQEILDGKTPHTNVFSDVRNHRHF